LPLNTALLWSSVGDADRAFGCLGRESFQEYLALHAVWWDLWLDVPRGEVRFTERGPRADGDRSAVVHDH
jgi:hypothetical protein